MDQGLELGDNDVPERHIYEGDQENWQVADDKVEHEELLRLGHFVRVCGSVVLPLGQSRCDAL